MEVAVGIYYYLGNWYIKYEMERKHADLTPCLGHYFLITRLILLD